MVKVRFIAHDGTIDDITAEAGKSLMEAARDFGIAGIDADCGGVCACATCHVFVDPVWLNQVEDRSDMEISMLDLADGATDQSRLACQIKLSASLDGIVVKLPEFQR